MKLIQISLLTWMAFACQGPSNESDAKVQGSSDSKTVSNAAPVGSSSNESDSSEGVVGPDETFFAGVYLESVFAASQSNPRPSLEPEQVQGVNLKSSQVEAFDFAANLQPRRLGLMSRILIKLGDKDGDGNLSATEFAALKLSADLKGAAGTALGHAFDKTTFEAVAGEDTLLSSDEIQELLSGVSHESKLSKLSKQEARKALVGDWEKVLKAYDADANGKLSLEEQTKLRKDRALIVSRFAAD